jgi:histidinol phosphatase-like enzyme
VNAVYACPHQISACACGKPHTGLLLKTQREHPAPGFPRAAIAGDRSRAVQARRRLSLTAVSLSEREGSWAAACVADHVVADPIQAATLLAQARWSQGNDGLRAAPTVRGG